MLLHANGSSEPLAAGMPVFLNDLVSTGQGGAVELEFVDGTTLSLGANGQLQLDNLIFDPAGANNSLDATVIKGSFVFITGKIGSAQGEGVQIDTPAGTIGIRGTSGAGTIDPQSGAWIFTLFRDPNGTLSRFTITNAAGAQLLDQEFESTEIAGSQIRPSQTFVLSQDQASALFGDALLLLQEQFPQLQSPERRGELENINPAAGNPYAIEQGQGLPDLQALADLYGSGTLANTLTELLAAGSLDPTSSSGATPGGRDSFQTPVDTFLPVPPETVLSPPVDVDPQPNVVAEGATTGSVVGITTLATDPRFSGPVTYSLLNDAGGAFAIDPVTGVITVADGKLLDFEQGNSFTVIVRATDGVHTSVAPLVITLQDINEPPDAPELSKASVAENSPGAVIGTLSAADPDKGDSVTFSVSDDRFEIVGNQLKLKDSVSLDHESPDVISVKVTVTDSGGLSTTRTFVIEVTNVNDAPVAVDDKYDVTEDGTLAVTAASGLLGNDKDADGDKLAAVLVDGPSHGHLTLNADGSFTYTPDADYNGPDSFSYKINDGTADSGIAAVNLTVAPANDPPVAVEDKYTVGEDGTLDVPASLGLLANDKDIDGDQLTAVLVEGPAHGELSLNADGSFTYTPDADYNGTDSFSYRANDGTADGNIATVNLAVTAVNDPPVAGNDKYFVGEDGTLTVSADLGVFANDKDIDGDTLTAVLVDGPAHGQLTLNADGSFTYKPNADFNGTDSFSYKASDGVADSNVATVNLTVTPVNDPPVAGDDRYTVEEDGSLIVTAALGLLVNDKDADGDKLEVQLVDGPAHGKLTLNADGSFTYTPVADYSGPDSFSYKVNDGTADSNIATVNLTVSAVNDPPVVADDKYELGEDETLTVTAAHGVLANDKDADGDQLTAVLVEGPAHGELTLNDDGSFTYRPDADYHGADSFTYKASDGTTDGNIATVNLTVAAVNDPPVARGDEYAVAEDDSLTIPAALGVLANDKDVDGDKLEAVLVEGPAHGKLALNADGSFTYTPDADYHGADSITYKANDGTVDGNIASVNITVTSVNDAPVAGGDKYAVAEDGTLTVTAALGVLANDNDIDGDKLTAVLVEGPAHGQLTLNADGSFTYKPNADFNGTDSFTYKASDGAADSGVATVNLTVTPVNDPPVASDDKYAVAEDGMLTVTTALGVLANDKDIDGDKLTAVLVDGPAHGQLTLNADGSFTYTPNADFNGTDSFTYKANDGKADSNVATVNLTVTPVNDPPVAKGDSFTIAEDGKLTVAAAGILANDNDVDGDKLTAALVESPAHGQLTLNSDGSFTYTPNADFNGTDSFTYKANDGKADSNVATVNLTVTPVNDPPEAGGDKYSIAEDGALTVTAGLGVLANDKDIEHDKLTAVLVEGPAHGRLSLNADGSFAYTPDADFNGTDGFTYKANDGKADSNVTTVNLTVTAVNDDPSAQADKYGIAEDGTLTITTALGVLANDKDVDGDKLSALLIEGPAHGELTLNLDGSFTYTSDADFNGTDSFTYKASDGTASDAATVTIEVTPVNDPPAAGDDGPFTTHENEPVAIPIAQLLANDKDVDGDKLVLTEVTRVTGGSVAIEGGNVIFTPDSKFDGEASFTYKFSDGHGGSDTATVKVNVVDDAPIAKADTVQTSDRSTQTIDLVIIFDRSGSMGNSPDVPGFSTRQELANAAIAALFEAYGSIATLNIQIVDFASTASQSGWLTTAEQANAYLAGLTPGGGTNYAAAIQTAMAAYANAPKADQSEVYFLSDGEPSVGQSLREAGLVERWEAFLSNPTNHIDRAFAVGIGGIQPNDPDLADVAFPNNDPSTLVVVTDEGQLTDTLVGTIVNTATGNVLGNDQFGVDGPGNGGVGLLSITVDGVTYTFDGTEITNDHHLPVIAGAKLVVITGLGGTLEFHFDGGDYSYAAPDVTQPAAEDFSYVIVDGDGSMAGATLHIDITDSGIVERHPSMIVGTNNADKLIGGTLDDIMSGGNGNDTILGNGGNDHIQGGAGDDSLSGGAGADIILGGAGNDTILLVDITNFVAIYGGDAGKLDLSKDAGDRLQFDGTLDLTTAAGDCIHGIETLSMADGSGDGRLIIAAADIIGIGAGHLDPPGSFGDFGTLTDAPAIRVDGDKGDVLTLADVGWVKVTGAAPVVPGYDLYVHDTPGGTVTEDAYLLVQTTVTVNAG